MSVQESHENDPYQSVIATSNFEADEYRQKAAMHLGIAVSLGTVTAALGIGNESLYSLSDTDYNATMDLVTTVFGVGGTFVFAKSGVGSAIKSIRAGNKASAFEAAAETQRNAS